MRDQGKRRSSPDRRGYRPQISPVDVGCGAMVFVAALMVFVACWFSFWRPLFAYAWSHHGG